MLMRRVSKDSLKYYDILTGVQIAICYILGFLFMSVQLFKIVLDEKLILSILSWRFYYQDPL